MTLQLDPGPGVSTYTSTVWETTVDGQAQHCWGITKDTHAAATGFWAQGEDVHAAWCMYGADVATTVRINLTELEVGVQGSEIVTAFVYPRRIYDDRSEIQGGELVISVPVNGKCVVVVNGVRKQRLHILSNPLDEGYEDATTYDGTQVEATGGETLVFPAGVHDLVNAGAWGANLFPIKSNATIVLERGAYVIGSFDMRIGVGTAADNVTIRGGGILSGEYTTWETVSALPTFDEQFAHSMIFNYAMGDRTTGVTIKEIAVVNTPFYGIMAGNEISDLLLLSPWRPNTDGIGFNADTATDECALRRCVIWSGDDAAHVQAYHRNATVEDCIISSSGSCCIILSYQTALPNEGFTTTCTNNTLLPCVGWYETVSTSGGDLIKCQIDSAEAEHGRFSCTFDGVYVDGDVNHAMIFNFGNQAYQWGTPLDLKGQLSGFTFRNVVVETNSSVKSQLLALDWQNAPCDVHFSMVVEGVEVTVANYLDYFEPFGPYPYRIFFGERVVTTAEDICNTALSYVGERDRVTDIDPVDGSEEARHCARAYTEAFEELLAMHNWSFATRKSQWTVVNADSDDTDDPAWSYRYELPADLVEILAVLPDGHTEDYVLGDVKQPQNFQRKYSEDDEVERLYTNVEDAWVRYTRHVTNPGECSVLFIAALKWLIAAKIAGTIVRGDSGEQIKNRCLAMFGKYLAEAKTKDARQRQVHAMPDPSWMTARGGARTKLPWNTPTYG